jgi:hypothetical protein
MDLLFVFIAWMVLCFAAAFYAEKKGRSGARIFFLSLFLSPLVGFLVAVVMEPNQQTVAAAKGMKRCPDCAEFVQPDARVCRFCRHAFAAETIQPVTVHPPTLWRGEYRSRAAPVPTCMASGCNEPRYADSEFCMGHAGAIYLPTTGGNHRCDGMVGNAEEVETAEAVNNPGSVVTGCLLQTDT